MKDSGNLTKILGKDTSRNIKSDTLCVSQRSYLEKWLKLFSMLDVKPV